MTELETDRNGEDVSDRRRRTHRMKTQICRGNERRRDGETETETETDRRE